MEMNGDGNDKTQLFTTVLAYSLPLLQFFFGQLTSTVKNLFLFQSYFVVVSVFTAIVSYVMITVLRARYWFSIIPMQWRRKKRVNEWNTYTNPSIYTTEEIKEYQHSHKPPKKLWNIDANNVIPAVFLPCILIGFGVFVWLGITYGGGSHEFVINNSQDAVNVLVQAAAYTSFIVFAVLSFAHQYYREAGMRSYNEKISNKYEKMIKLARHRDVFKEQKKISLITQKSAVIGDPNAYIIFIVEVDKDNFVIITDSEIDTIIAVKKFDDLSDAEAFVWGKEGEVEASE